MPISTQKMSISPPILILSSIFTFNACSRITPTYEVFEYNKITGI